MNVNDIKNSLTRSFGRAGLQLQKHSPEILLGVGLIGMAATVYLAVKAAKQDQVKEKHEINIRNFEHIVADQNLTKEEEMKGKTLIFVQTSVEYGKLYGPALSVGVASLVAILASHGMMSKRQASLIAAYNLLQEGYQSYRSRVVAELGEEKDRDFHLGLKDETHTETVIDEETGTKTKKKVTTKVLNESGKAPSIYSRFFDESNPMWRTDRTLNKAFLIAQQNYLNDLLIIRNHVYLNEAYERLGFPHTKEGAIVGWILTDPEIMEEEGRAGYINLGIYDVDNDPGREFVNGTNPSILLDFNVDGIMFNKV